jgi:hypothetical protein
MNYNLAKQLKDNGFPQKEKRTGDVISIDGLEQPDYPTLSELIEACGDEIGLLPAAGEQKKEGMKWWAMSEPGGETYYEYALSGYGLTPEEAVAKLWIELNKPTQNFIKESGE